MTTQLRLFAMRYLRSKIRRGQVGSAPGTLIHIGDQKVDQARLSLIDYNSTAVTEKTGITLDDALTLCNGPNATWLNIDGLHDTDLIGRLGHHFDIHPLTLEDILNTGQRPKWEDFGHYLYVVLRTFRLDAQNSRIVSEQVSLIVTSKVLMSFQESESDIFEPVRARLHKGRGRIRTSSHDYLAYALMDSVVDHYFVVLDRIGEEIDDLEVKILDEPHPDLLKSLHALKWEAAALRKHIWPLREVIVGMSKDDSTMISDATTMFLRDVYDHIIQVIDTIESYRDLLSGLMDLYLTTVSNKMNEVMKVLTIMASLFIPLTFIAGIYGMNFEYMPELKWPWGYGAVWLVMILLAVMMLIYFKRKRWL